MVFSEFVDTTSVVRRYKRMLKTQKDPSEDRSGRRKKKK
jgi:hypothetical protein